MVTTNAALFYEDAAASAVFLWRGQMSFGVYGTAIFGTMTDSDEEEQLPV